MLCCRVTACRNRPSAPSHTCRSGNLSAARLKSAGTSLCVQCACARPGVPTASVSRRRSVRCCSRQAGKPAVAQRRTGRVKMPEEAVDIVKQWHVEVGLCLCSCACAAVPLPLCLAGCVFRVCVCTFVHHVRPHLISSQNWHNREFCVQRCVSPYVYQPFTSLGVLIAF